MEVRQIRLKRDTEMTTGYRGRGKPSRSVVVPAGTLVHYSFTKTLAGNYHEVSIVIDGQQYSAAKKEERENG